MCYRIQYYQLRIGTTHNGLDPSPQSLNKKMGYRLEFSLSYGGIYSVEPSSFQMVLVSVKLA